MILEIYAFAARKPVLASHDAVEAYRDSNEALCPNHPQQVPGPYFILLL